MPDDVKALCGREKYWEECTDSEKIDRLREELMSQLRINGEIARMLEKLLVHQHFDGTLTVPVTFREDDPKHTYGFARRPSRLMTAQERGQR
jgi:hypothetical protein